MNTFPRIIHQCFLGFDGPIPEKWKQNHKNGKSYTLVTKLDYGIWRIQFV